MSENRGWQQFLDVVRNAETRHITMRRTRSRTCACFFLLARFPFRLGDRGRYPANTSMRMKSSLTWMSCFVALLCIGCNDSAQLIDISTKTLPFTKSVNMKKGDAFRLRMPDGLELAFWCESQDFPVAEQTTSSGLDLGWGEKPFRFSPVVYERDSDEKKASTHILFEGCLLYTSPSPRDLSTSRMPSSA